MSLEVLCLQVEGEAMRADESAKGAHVTSQPTDIRDEKKTTVFMPLNIGVV